MGLVLVVMIMSVLGLHAQNVTIQGRVLDANDESPLAGVGYAVIGTEASGLTLDDGEYKVTVPKKATIDVFFRIPDVGDTTMVVTIEEGKDLYQIDMVAGQKKDITIDVTVITAGRHEQKLAAVTGSMDVIKPAAVDLQASSDIKDALVQSSGVDIIDGQPNIRGSSGYAYGVGSRVMVMLDGLPLLSPDASFAQFDMIPTDNLAQIEVMKGASSVLYGSSALGGVINVIMADAPSKPMTSVRLRGQMYDNPADKSLDWDSTKHATSAGINVFHARKIGRHDLTLLGDFWKESGYRYQTGGHKGRFQVMTKFRPKAVPGMTYGVNASARYDSSSTFLFWDSYHPGDSVVAFGSSTPFQSRGAYAGEKSSRDQFNWRVTVDPFVKYLGPKGNMHQYRARYLRTSNNNNTGQSSENSMFYNDYQFTTHLWDERITWVSGGTAIFNAVNSDSIFSGGHRSMNAAVYTQMDAKLHSKVNASLGARFDNWNIDGNINESSPIFRAGINYELVKGSNFRASVGQAFRSPSIAERYTNTFASGLIIRPNPDLLVEKGFSAELGYRQGFLFGTKKRSVLGYVDVAGFVMDYNNMIEFGVIQPETLNILDLTPNFSAKNFSDARISGVEGTAMVQITHDKFRFDFNGGITYMNPVNLNPAPDSIQVDFYNTIGPQDSASNNQAFGMLIAMMSPADSPFSRVDNPSVLKYRSKWLNRFSATVGYGRFNLTANYRYKSEILAIDQFLYIAIPGSADWVRSHPGGYGLLDMIFATKVNEHFTFSLHAENIANREWAILPGIIGEQRNYSVQLKFNF